jgi:N-methylhydantoinase A
MLVADLRQDYIRTHITPLDQADPARVEAIFHDMEVQASEDLAAQHSASRDVVYQRLADMRYQGQEHTVKVPMPAGEIDTGRILDINRRFHQAHEHSYTFRLELPVELVNYHLIALGKVAKPALKTLDGKGASLGAALKGRRTVNFDELGFHQAPVYERDWLPIDHILEGPLVIEEPASTTVVFPEQQVTRDQYGFLHIEKAS